MGKRSRPTFDRSFPMFLHRRFHRLMPSVSVFGTGSFCLRPIIAVRFALPEFDPELVGVEVRLVPLPARFAPAVNMAERFLPFPAELDNRLSEDDPMGGMMASSKSWSSSEVEAMSEPVESSSELYSESGSASVAYSLASKNSEMQEDE